MILDYRKLGLKCGIEIHQQLDTEHKLFCSCPTKLSEKESCGEVRRKLSAVAGESGKIDAAAMHETLLDKTFIYRVFCDENCLVETDSEPPHSLDMEALGTTLKVSMMLGCEIPEEIHVMRKTVVDGSNTSGFQRTLIAGMNGRLKAGKCTVGITNVCLEEDSAQIIERCNDEVVYGLDRLGIPLIEIGTSPDIHTPEDAKDIAERIGMILRSTGKVKRGLGTIRQDINVSIGKGARIEIKGAQDLRMIPKYIENEATRQLSILSISGELKKKGVKNIASRVTDVTGFFSESDSGIMRGKKSYAIIVPGFEGMLARKITETRTLGNEIANYVKVKVGIPGFIHSDENLEKYRLDREFAEIGKKLGAEKGDTLIIMAAEKDIAVATGEAFEERINQFIGGIPMEVRRALDNGDTEFMRPMAGSARMYPETDVAPISVTKGMLSETRKNLPETWDRRIKRIARSYNISDDISGQLVKSGMDEMFESLAKKSDAGIVSNTLISTFKEIEREGHETDNITPIHLRDLFGLVSSRKIAKEAVPVVLRKIAENPNLSVGDITGKMKTVSSSDLSAVIRKIISEKKELLNHPRREKVLMGLVMKEVRGAVDGKTVMDALARELKKH